MQVNSSPAEPQGKPQNTRVGSLSLLQRIFLTQELNWGLLHFRRNLYQLSCQFSSVQLLSRVRLFATPQTAATQPFLSVTNSRSLLKLMSIESVMSSNHFILCLPLLLLPSIFSNIRVFSSESVLHTRWPKLLEPQLQHQSFQ